MLAHSNLLLNILSLFILNRVGLLFILIGKDVSMGTARELEKLEVLL